MAATFHKVNQFAEDIAKKVHNLNSDTLKVAFSNTTPNVATMAVLGDISEITPGNGYSAGGIGAAFVSGAQSGGTYKLVLSDPTFTASGGTVGPFRYAWLYNSTPSSPLKPLVGYWDYADVNPGAPNITLADGETFTLDLDQTAGVLTIG